jgi:L-ascorbate metabolism protein UlaG (beta-lactamase superfamily)
VKRVLGAVVLLALVAWSALTHEPLVGQPGTPSWPAGPGSAASTTTRATDRFSTARGDLVVTPLEHASVLLGWDGKAIYVDPTTPPIDDVTLPKADVIFVTEARFDHLDAVALQRVSRPGTIVVGGTAVGERARVDAVMSDGETREILGIVATAVPLYSVERGPGPGLRYHDRGLGHGYVLDFAGTRVYFSGDTECTPETMALERIDVAFVAVSGPTSMSPGEAARCIEAMRPHVVFPYHDRRMDLSGLERALVGQGIEVREREFYPRPETFRTQAFESCAHGRWGVCRDQLDLARTLDPMGETDPRVVHARAQVRAWQSPFPPWW